MQTSYVFECNEKTSLLGLTESKADFGVDYDSHIGWRSSSSDGTYRILTVPAGATMRTFEWVCSIGGKDAVIKIWHQSTPKNELIDKYGIQHERCGLSRRIRFTYADKVILQDVLMRNDGCDQMPMAKLSSLYFGKAGYLKQSLSKVLGSAFSMTGRGILKNDKSIEYDILIDQQIINYLTHFEDARNLHTKLLPISAIELNDFLDTAK
jgi:hypothetical protein